MNSNIAVHMRQLIRLQVYTICTQIIRRLNVRGFRSPGAIHEYLDTGVV